MSQIDFRRPFYGPQVAPAVTKSWHPIEALRHQIEHFYNDLSGGLWAQQYPSFVERTALPSLFRDFPPVDIAETDIGYEIATELPGVSEKDVEVSIDRGTLQIKGARHEERKDSHKGYFLQERSFGSFDRAFRLPEDADSAKVEALFKNGVLTVRIPKTAGAGKDVKKVAVKAA